MKSQLLILFLFVALSWSQTPNRPIIGIVALPSEFDEYPSNLWSYFPASYAKFLESGGAQVVPIQYDLPTENITYLLNSLNGVFFTGGGTPMINPDGSFTPIGATLNFVVNYVVEQNKNGTYYPIWGTCMGFQAIAGLLEKSFSILTPDCVGCDGINKNNFFNTDYQSRLYAQIPEDLHEKMTYANLSSFFHHSMLHYDTFVNATPLNSILTPTTYTYDQTGVKYVSSYESPSMPIYGTQFHQEISTYEWLDPVGVNHGPDAVRLQQYLSKFFVNETKKNTNSFPDQQQYLIENFNPVVDHSASFSSLYFFPAVNKQVDLEEKLIEDNIRLFLE